MTNISARVPGRRRRRSGRDGPSISCIVIFGSMYKFVESHKGLGQITPVSSASAFVALSANSRSSASTLSNVDKAWSLYLFWYSRMRGSRWTVDMQQKDTW